MEAIFLPLYAVKTPFQKISSRDCPLQTVQQHGRLNNIADLHASEMDYFAQTFVETAKMRTVKTRQIRHVMNSFMTEVQEMMDKTMLNSYFEQSNMPSGEIFTFLFHRWTFVFL